MFEPVLKFPEYSYLLVVSWELQYNQYGAARAIRTDVLNLLRDLDLN